MIRSSIRCARRPLEATAAQVPHFSGRRRQRGRQWEERATREIQSLVESKFRRCLDGIGRGRIWPQVSNISRPHSSAFSNISDHLEDSDQHRSDRSSDDITFTRIVDGPPTRLGANKLAQLADASVIGMAGNTTVFATVTSERKHDAQAQKPRTLIEALERKVSTYSSFVPFTVDYRQRHHAVGAIPTAGASRTDNRRPTVTETLGGRCIDRALRAVLRDDCTNGQPLHLLCSVQSSTRGEPSPLALAINAAAAALSDRIIEPIAATSIALEEDGTVIIGSSASAVCELLYVATSSRVVMMEFFGDAVPESKLIQLIELAHASIKPMLETQEKMTLALDMVRNSNAAVEDDAALRQSLGLVLSKTDGVETVVDNADDENNDFADKALEVFDELLFKNCEQELGDVALRLFGANSSSPDRPDSSGDVSIHPKRGKQLLTKAVRGRREHLVRMEIERIVRSVLSKAADPELQTIPSSHPGLVERISDSIHSKLLKQAFIKSVIDHGTRADGRKDTHTIRPLSVSVPALPPTVHGSAVFARGDTQVLCTATLGAPQDGRPLQGDPFEMSDREKDGDEQPAKDEDENKLPVGSLRYLKTQEHLLSDLNTRKVRADREQTGDSGTFQDRRRAMLQYDFPAYSKGSVATEGRGGAARREIGHGALAERSVVPMLPPPSEFPYAIRLTSEVTASNGSSSLATVCGSTLALLDAGVPITDPVAGISVGLAMESDDRYRLLLDLTGTEDHYGGMDFKIAGTRSGVTGLQLDVKHPVPHEAVFEALHLARRGRAAILDDIKDHLKPRSTLKASAPRVAIVRFDPMRKKDLLGPGGVVIRQMEERYNVSLDLTQEGVCLLFGADAEMVRKAKSAIMELVADVVVGGVYEGTVIDLKDFGAIIELLRNKEGICHISLMADREDIRAHPRGALGLLQSLLQLGQKIEVRVRAVDVVQGSIQLEPASKLVPSKRDE